MNKVNESREGVNIRLPEGMREVIQQRAKENQRSMNAEIVFHLQNAIGYKTEKQKADAMAS